jgi:hypothetical protein
MTGRICRLRIIVQHLRRAFAEVGFAMMAREEHAWKSGWRGEGKIKRRMMGATFFCMIAAG